MMAEASSLAARIAHFTQKGMDQLKAREKAEAEGWFRRAVELAETAPVRPLAVAIPLRHLALLLRQDGRMVEAEKLCRQALEVVEGAADPDLLEVAALSNNLAQILCRSERTAEAESLMRRAVAIYEPRAAQHPAELAASLNNLALLLASSHRGEEAEPLARRQVELLHQVERASGESHPWKAPAVELYEELLLDLGFRRRQAQVRLHAIIDGRPLGALSIDDLPDETIPDFDRLSIAANAEAADIADQDRLFAATFALREWLFLARGELSDVAPYVAANRSIAGGAPMVKAFTDADRLRTFAASNQLLATDGSVQILSLPVGGVFVTLDDLASQGVSHIHFNADECSDGYFVPLRQLRPIRGRLLQLGLIEES